MGFSGLFNPFRAHSSRSPHHMSANPPRRKRTSQTPPLAHQQAQPSHQHPASPLHPQHKPPPSNPPSLPLHKQSSPRRHLKFIPGHKPPKPTANPPHPHHQSRRAHSLAHYSAGFDPSRPAHYPNSRTPDYSPPDPSPRRLFSNHLRPPSNHSRPPSNPPPSAPRSRSRSRRPASRIVSNLDNYIRRDHSSDRRMAAPRRKRVTSLLQPAAVDNHANIQEPHSFDCLPKLPATDLHRLAMHNQNKHIHARDLSHHARPPAAAPKDLQPSPHVRYSADIMHRPRVSVDLPSPRRSADILSLAVPLAHSPRSPPPPTRPSIDLNPPVSPDDAPLPVRMSADAAIPSRMSSSSPSPLFRTSSNPSAGVSRYGRKERPLHRMRPPPLKTSSASPGVATGSLVQVKPVRFVSAANPSAHIVPTNPNESTPVMATLSSFITEDSDANEGPQHDSDAAAAAPKNLPSKRPQEGEDQVNEPKAYTKDNNVWANGNKHSLRKSQDSRKHKSGSRRHRKSLDTPDMKLQGDANDLYDLPIASESSSFSGSDTPSQVAARNGIFPMDAGHGNNATDNVFMYAMESRSGFIWNCGRIETGGRYERRISNGLTVEGVSTSGCSDLIIVRSLSELKKTYTFKSKSENLFTSGTAVLGSGAAGRVYLAKHIPTGKKVAVKEINIIEEDMRKQFRNDYITLTSYCSRFLVRSFGAFYDSEGRAHVTLEYMDRGSLADVIRKTGPLPEPVICKIAEHCLRGLRLLHGHRVMHRDVKTANILLSGKWGVAKLSDFGIARSFSPERKVTTTSRGDIVAEIDGGDASSVTKTYIGTLEYMSPERIFGNPYTYASDIWGLGVSILECVLGYRPFRNMKSMMEIYYRIDLVDKIVGQVSDELVDLIRLMTDRDPLGRPKAAELLDHACLGRGRHDPHALRNWLDAVPKLHSHELDSMGGSSRRRSHRR